MLETQISEAMKEAMKAKDSSTLTALRGMKAAFLNLKTSVEFAGKDVPEESKLKALQKMVKQRNDSAEIYKKADRTELYNQEIFEISVIEKFLPKKMTDVEVENAVKDAITETGASSIKDMSKVMGLLTKNLAGKADNKVVSGFVKQLLS